MSDGLLDYIEEHPSDQGGGRLGRNVVWHDPQNREFPARGVLFAAEAEIIRQSWWLRHRFDQNGYSQCTAEAAAGLLFTSPFRIELDRLNLGRYDELMERHALYRAAQKVDPWEGEDYEGSSTDAPFKVLREQGHIREWRWCFGLDDVLQALSHHGPVAVGTWWYEGMDVPQGPDGEVFATGERRGGHAWELYAVAPSDDYEGGGYVDAMQSWGYWGPRGGRFRVSWATLEQLLEEEGEAVTVVL